MEWTEARSEGGRDGNAEGGDGSGTEHALFIANFDYLHVLRLMLGANAFWQKSLGTQGPERQASAGPGGSSGYSVVELRCSPLTV